VATLVVTLKFTATWLILLWRKLRLWLTPAPVRAARVRARAVSCFKVGAERRTHGRTGILIYLSLAEHRAEIVADEAIASKVAPEVWGDAMAAMLAELRQDRLADGLIAAVTRVGAVLADHFPRAENDVNELPDRLIEV
jgi:putative membrane protein